MRVNRERCWCGEHHPPFEVDNTIQAHHCTEWDYMYVTNEHPEFEACLCFKTRPATDDSQT